MNAPQLWDWYDEQSRKLSKICQEAWAVAVAMANSLPDKSAEFFDRKYLKKREYLIKKQQYKPPRHVKYVQGRRRQQKPADTENLSKRTNNRSEV